MGILNFFKLGFGNLSFWLKKRVRIKQLRLKIESTQGELTELFAHVGKDVYRDQSHISTDPASQTVYNKIAELEDILFALEQEIVAEQKKAPHNTTTKKVLSYARDDEATQNCPKCHTIMPAAAVFCSSCGRRLQRAEPTQDNPLPDKE